MVFAAANGHLGVIELLLARGARWNVTDKNGATPAAVAVHHGQTAAAELLQRWAEAHGTSATGNGEGSSRSSAPRGLSLLPSFSSVSLQSLGQGSTTSRSLAHMRSLDALPHNHGSARPANLSRASSVSNVAVDTSSSASSFRHAPAPASAIGPRGTMHRQFSSPLVPQAADTTSHLPSSTPPATSADASRDWRRPSVSSVMERMAGSALKNAFKAGGAVETPREAGQKLHKSASKTSLSKVIRGRGSSTDVSGAGDEAEQPKRRSSFDVARKLADRRTRSATSPVSGAPSDSSLRLDVTASDSIAPPATSAQSQSTFVPHSASVTSLSAAAAKGFYRPRKSSQLSGPTRSAEDYEGESDSTSDEDFLVASPRRMRDEPDFDSVRPAFTLEPSIKAAARARARSKGSGMIGHPQVSLHHRSSSGGSSGSGLSSALPSPPLSRRNTPADRDGRPAPPFGGGDDADREEADPSVHGWDEASKAEATDRFPAEMPRFGHQRTGSNRGRERADSASSVASSGSPAVTASGPWPRRHGTDSNQQLDGSRTDSPTRSTRPSRSGSLSTDGGPNQISVASTTSTSPASLNSVLSGQASSVTGATSNMSAMGMLSPVYEDRSSTDAAGARAERPSPAITISAEEAHARVKKAERDLLNFNLSDANGRKMSLSDSLAAYGDSLNLEDAARALEAKRKKGSESASPAYTWETLSKDGSRTTVDARGERRVQGPPTRVGLSPQGPPSFLPLDQRNGQRSLANKKNAGVPAIAVPTSDKSTSGDDASRVSGFGSQKGRHRHFQVTQMMSVADHWTLQVAMNFLGRQRTSPDSKPLSPLRASSKGRGSIQASWPRRLPLRVRPRGTGASARRERFPAGRLHPDCPTPGSRPGRSHLSLHDDQTWSNRPKMRCRGRFEPRRRRRADSRSCAAGARNDTSRPAPGRTRVGEPKRVVEGSALCCRMYRAAVGSHRCHAYR